MTLKSDQDEDMSMEEILASIRQFVTDSSHDPIPKQAVYMGDLSKSVIIPPKETTASKIAQEKGRTSSQRYSAPISSHNSIPSHNQRSESHHTASMPTSWLPEADVLELRDPMERLSHQPPPHKTVSRLEADILELNSSIPSLPTDTETSIEWETSINPGMILEESIISPKRIGSLHHETQKGSEEGNSIASSQALAASANSLSHLAKTAKSTFNKRAELKTSSQHNMTLEQLIRDMVRPMIKEWVDKNLASLVEEMVAKEIERITKHLE